MGAVEGRALLSEGKGKEKEKELFATGDPDLLGA